MRQQKKRYPIAKFAKTRTDLARALACARPTLRKWMMDPEFPAETPKGWPLAGCRRYVTDHALDRLPELAAEKRRLLSAQANLAEMKLRREAEILVEKDAVKQSLAAIIGAWTGVLKRTISKEDYNACTRQFQKINYEL